MGGASSSHAPAKPPPAVSADSNGWTEEQTSAEAEAAAAPLASLASAETACNFEAASAGLQSALELPRERGSGRATLLPRSCLVLGRVCARLAADKHPSDPPPLPNAPVLLATISTLCAVLEDASSSAELALNAAWALDHFLSALLLGRPSTLHPLTDALARAARALASRLAAFAAAPPPAFAAACHALSGAEKLARCDSSALSSLLDADVPASAAKLLESHSAVDAMIATASLSLLSALSHEQDGRKAAFAAHAHAAACAAASPDCATGRLAPGGRAALKLLRVLSREAGADRETVAALCAVGAATAALAVHASDEGVVEEALWLLSQLTAAGPSGADGATVAACVAAMRSHPDAAAVQALSARALRNLTRDSVAAAEEPAEGNAFLRGLADALTLTNNPEARRRARAAAEAEALAARRGAAGAAGAGEALGQALARHGGGRLVGAAAAQAQQWLGERE